MKTKTFMLMAVLAAAALTGCTNNQKQTAETETIVTETAVTETDSADTAAATVDDQAKDYYTAVERYLAKQIGGQYAPGEYCVPVYQEIAVDDSDSTDIRIWGDFWVYNYKQEGDTLKCVSGGSHPGLMHVRQTGENFHVTAFEQVEDGSGFLPTAKRIFGEYFEAFQIHHSDSDEHESLRHDVLRAFVRDNNLTATKYQDHGWPAKDLDL